jgi:hypothetical protein
MSARSDPPVPDTVELVITGGIVGVVPRGLDLAVIEARFQAVPAPVFRHFSGEVVGSQNEERIVVGHAQVIEVGHGDVGELRE